MGTSLAQVPIPESKDSELGTEESQYEEYIHKQALMVSQTQKSIGTYILTFFLFAGATISLMSIFRTRTPMTDLPESSQDSEMAVTPSTVASRKREQGSFRER